MQNNNFNANIEVKKPFLQNDGPQVVLNVYPEQNQSNSPVANPYPQIPNTQNYNPNNPNYVPNNQNYVPNNPNNVPNNPNNVPNYQQYPPYYNYNNLSTDAMINQYLTTHSKENIQMYSNQIMSSAQFTIPKGFFNGTVNCHSDKADIGNRLLGSIMNENKGIQLSTVTNSAYFRAANQLIDQFKTYGRVGQPLILVLFFLSYILIMVRMMVLYLDVYYYFPYYPYYMHQAGFFNLLCWLYSVFFVFWLIDIFWYNRRIQNLRIKSLKHNLVFKCVIKNFFFLAIFIVNQLKLETFGYNCPNEYAVSISTFLIIVIFEAIESIQLARLFTSFKKFLVLTREIVI